MILLEAINIKKSFGNRLIIAFDELRIYSGDKIGIVGQNGSGKTTLMNILSKELEPDEGVVRINCEVKYIHQLTEEDINADKRLLSEFNLTQKTENQNYSGGEKTRIKLANAFNQENVLLFADEPTCNLDLKGIDLFKAKLSKEETYIVISHDRGLLCDYCDKILEINDGCLKSFNGNYIFYKEQKELAYKSAQQEYDSYISKKRRLENARNNFV